MPAPRYINLALGGGGAKGIVHLGVLKAVDELGYTLSSLVGTSIGAVWAALLAKMIHRHRHRANAQSKAIEHLTKEAVHYHPELHRDIDLLGCLTRSFVKGERVEEWLALHLLDAETRTPFIFGALDVDLVVTVADAQTGQSILCDRKNTPDLEVAKAVRASMSIPGVFKPVILPLPDGKGGSRSVPCWDGGVTGNCRFDIAARRSPHAVIASSLTYRNEPRNVGGGAFRIFAVGDHVSDILLASVESAVWESLSPTLRNRICILRPPLSGIRTSSFRIKASRRKQAIETAYSYAKEELRRHSVLLV